MTPSGDAASAERDGMMTSRLGGGEAPAHPPPPRPASRSPRLTSVGNSQRRHASCPSGRPPGIVTPVTVRPGRARTIDWPDVMVWVVASGQY